MYKNHTTTITQNLTIPMLIFNAPRCGHSESIHWPVFISNIYFIYLQRFLENYINPTRKLYILFAHNSYTRTSHGIILTVFEVKLYSYCEELINLPPSNRTKIFSPGVRITRQNAVKSYSDAVKQKIALSKLSDV